MRASFLSLAVTNVQAEAYVPSLFLCVNIALNSGHYRAFHAEFFQQVEL